MHTTASHGEAGMRGVVHQVVRSALQVVRELNRW